MEPLREALVRIRVRAEGTRRQSDPTTYHARCWEQVDQVIPLIEACEILAKAARAVECSERCTGLGDDYTGGHHYTCPVEDLEAALSAAAQRLAK